MKTAITIMILIVDTTLADIMAHCDMAGFYHELGCTPDDRGGTRGICPIVFDCPDYYPDKSKCFYRGVAYEYGARILPSEIKNPCSRSCVCRKSKYGPLFECATVDCAENNSTGCIVTYDSLDACCPAKTICGKKAISSLTTCEVKNMVYREGESFEPENWRKICVCTAQWDGDIDNQQNCRDVNCGLELYYQTKIARKCAPVFYGQSVGCPIGFVCPSKKIKVKSNNNAEEVTEKCIFGKRALSVGDDVVLPDACIRCRCRVPPFVVCRRKMICQM